MLLMECNYEGLNCPHNVECRMLVSRRRQKGLKVGSTLEFRKSFVIRLIQACDESKLIPPPHQGRQQVIADKLGVAPEAVSKWFKAVSMPRPDKLERLAEILQVDPSWLAFGISPEMKRSERKAHVREVDGAVHLVLGMVMLIGGHCGLPSKNDPRASYVDFYVTLRGSVYPMHVALGRELSANQFEVMLPKEYADVRSVAVMPAGGGKYQFLDLSLPLIEVHKGRKTGGVVILINRVESGKYMTGGDVWPRIKTFSELT